jgi:hypothetical protein
LFEFAATITPDIAGEVGPGASPSRQAAQQINARAFCNESFIVLSDSRRP